MNLADKKRTIGRAALLAVPICVLVLAASLYVVRHIMVLPTNTADSIIFVLRADLFVVLWVLIAISRVSHSRRHSKVDIDAAVSGPPSGALAIQIAFLQNTLEQAFLAVAVHLALSTWLTGDALGLIVGSIVLFGIGRTAFWIGYKGGAAGRAFGMLVTMLPTIAGFVFALVLLLQGAS